jgi:hypothetical protein
MSEEYKEIIRKRDFVNNFVREFLASWAALNYDECRIKCPGDLVDAPPIEDAKFIATEIYNKLHRSPMIETPCSLASLPEKEKC